MEEIQMLIDFLEEKITLNCYDRDISHGELYSMQASCVREADELCAVITNKEANIDEIGRLTYCYITSLKEVEDQKKEIKTTQNLINSLEHSVWYLKEIQKQQFEKT